MPKSEIARAFAYYLGGNDSPLPPIEDYDNAIRSALSDLPFYQVMSRNGTADQAEAVTGRYLDSLNI